MTNRNSKALLAAMGALAANTPAFASPPTVDSPSQQKMETLNVASFRAIESTWLTVPAVCKARAFNAEAVPQTVAGPSQQAQAIYAVYGA